MGNRRHLFYSQKYFFNMYSDQYLLGYYSRLGFSFLIRFRLELFVLDNKALVAASADLSFGVVSGNIEYETTSVYLDKFSLAPYGHSKRSRCVVCYV